MRRAEDREVDRERRLLLLPAQRRFEVGVAAVDHDAVARDEGRHEERQAHDVVPVQVRQEDVVGLGRRPRARHRGLAEGAQAAAQVADHVVGAAGLDLDARGVAAVGAGSVKARPSRKRSSRRRWRTAGRARARSAARNLCAHAGGGQRDRQRAAGAPEAHALHGAPAPRVGGERRPNSAPARRRRVGKTLTTWSKRLISKISRTTAAAPPPRLRLALAQLLGGHHQDAQADAADVVDLRQVEHQGAAAARPAPAAAPGPARRRALAWSMRPCGRASITSAWRVTSCTASNLLETVAATGGAGSARVIAHRDAASRTGCGRHTHCPRAPTGLQYLLASQRRHRIGGLLARVRMRPVGREQGSGGVRCVLQRVVVVRPARRARPGGSRRGSRSSRRRSGRVRSAVRSRWARPSACRRTGKLSVGAWKP